MLSLHGFEDSLIMNKGDIGYILTDWHVCKKHHKIILQLATYGH